MSRSTKKGPFIEPKLLKKVEVVQRTPATGRYCGAWVDFAPVRDPALVADSVLDTLGVREDADSGLSTDRLARFVGDRPFLLCSTIASISSKPPRRLRTRSCARAPSCASWPRAAKHSA